MEVLVRTELEKVLDYHVVILYYNKIQNLTLTDIQTIIKEILIKNKLWKKYEKLIKTYYFNITFPLDLRFTDFYQIKYDIILADKTIHKNLILDCKVIYDI